MKIICVLDENKICHQMFEMYDEDMLTIEDEYLSFDEVIDSCVGKKWNGTSFETIKDEPQEQSFNITNTDILLAEILLEIQKIKLKLGGE